MLRNGHAGVNIALPERTGHTNRIARKDDSEDYTKKTGAGKIINFHRDSNYHRVNETVIEDKQL